MNKRLEEFSNHSIVIEVCWKTNTETTFERERNKGAKTNHLAE
nr:hypothetical protein [Mycoplasmopsis bovis]